MVTRIDKAIVAFAIAAAGTLSAAQVNGTAIDTTLLVSAAVVGLVAALGVWLTPNKAP